MNSTPVFSSRRRQFLALWAVIVAGFFLSIGSFPLFDVDEGAFAEATREMLERGDFISTYLNGVPRYDKPILIYWLQAASVTVFGLNEFAFRLPSALCSTLWVWLVFFFVRHYQDEATAVRAAFITTTALAVTIIGKAATADALLNVLLVAALFSIFAFYRERLRRFIYATFFFMGLGMLAKGPVAILIPFAVSLMFFAWRGEFKTWMRAIFHPGAWLLFLAIALPWYVAQYLKEGQAFIDGFFFKHNLDRFGGAMEQHGGSLWYYIPVVLIGVLPFTALALKVFARAREHLREDVALFAALWFGFVFIFFSLSGTKLPHYVNYGLTGLFVLMAIDAEQLRSRVLSLLPALLLFTVLLFLPEITTQFAPQVRDVYWREVAGELNFSMGYRAYFGACMVVLIYSMAEQHFALQRKLFLSGGLAIFGISIFLLPVLGQAVQAPVKEAARIARAGGYTVVMWHLNVPSFSVYRGQPTPARAPLSGEVVLTKRQYLAELPPHEVLYARNGIALARIKSP